jgi:hypothetical protein
MSHYKFGKNDIFHNTIKAYPQVEFIIYKKKVYYNKEISDFGQFEGNVLHMPEGHLSLYELNVDRPNDSLIYPFVTKEGSLASFSTVTDASFNSDFTYGDTITGSYPLSASISRDYHPLGDTRTRVTALKNTINYYQNLSPEYAFSSSARDFGNIDLNLISIPSIFYGSSIKKGSINLKFYVTGNLVAHARDENENGKLVQVGPEGSPGSGTIAGLALYNEGIIVLTGSTVFSSNSETYPPAGSSKSKWIHFGSTGSAGESVSNSQFSIDFRGTNYIPTLTMLAHAPKGELNHSNNPTFVKYSEVGKTSGTSSLHYFQNDEVQIKNTVSSSFPDPTGSFQKQVYISKIGLYDKDRNLIGVAKLATPVRKREHDSYTFKLKLDF